MNNPQTPLEKLISDKKHIQEQCRVQEQKLNNDLSYIQENAGSLLLSGFSSLLFPGNKPATNTSPNGLAAASPTGLSAIGLGASDYLSIAKSMLPMAWGLAQPLIVTWGMNKAKKWMTNLLFKKKK